MRRAAPLVLALCAAACDPAQPPAAEPARCGHAVLGAPLPRSAGAMLDPHARPLPLDDAGIPDDAQTHVGRAPRRLDVDQFRASLEGLLGARWTGPRTVITPEEPSGTRVEADADLVAFFAPTLGVPDYVVSTREVLDPTITFAKLATDAARSVCAAGVRLDVARPPAERRLLIDASETDTLPAGEAAIRRNLSTLALKLWAAEYAPESDAVTGMLGVFRAAVTQPGASALDGWRAVCIDLATDPRFLSY